jgi:hypothetical protein
MMDLYEKVGALFRKNGTLFLREELDTGEYSYRPARKSKHNDIQTVDVHSLIWKGTYAYTGTFGSTQKTVSYYADKNSVYIDYENRGDLCRLPGAASADFMLIPPEQNQIRNDNRFFFSYSNGTFYYRSWVMLFDPRLVTDLGNDYYRDGNALYYGYYMQVAPGYDIDTFISLVPERQTATARDRYHIYYKGVVEPDIDTSSFTFLDACVARNRARYVNCDISFYATDKISVYYICPPFQTRIKKLHGVNIASLRFYVDPLRKNYGFASDGVYEYNAGIRKKLPITKQKTT